MRAPALSCSVPVRSWGAVSWVLIGLELFGVLGTGSFLLAEVKHPEAGEFSGAFSDEEDRKSVV